MKSINYFSSAFKLGILGGGQLGKMLLAETRRYDIYTSVLDPSAEAPCKIGSNSFTQGALTDFETVYNFGKTVDVLTIEIENVNVEALEKLMAEGVAVHPKPALLRMVKNKARQKQFYADNQIATAPFQVFEDKNEALVAVKNGSWPMPFVWKSAEGGYDGFGVSIVRTEADLANIGDGACILEKLVPFVKELSVIIARNPDGQIAVYPVVEMEFHPTANQVEYVLCPANISSEIAKKAQKLATDLSEKIDLTGILAVEMFLTADGQILVNEVAPRTHNSGHISIENNYTSQFEQHLRAVCNMPLGSTTLKTPAVMANLVGEAGHSGAVVYKGYQELMAMPGVNIHIYGKKETRPFRKMGHVTAIAADIKTARTLAEKAKKAVLVVSLSMF